jgi:hypothetical protein
MSVIYAWIDPAAEELDRLLDAAPVDASLTVVIATTVLLIAWGNAVVIVDRRLTSSHGPRAAELFTLFAQAAAGVTGLVVLVLLGWAPEDLGIAIPRTSSVGPLGLPLLGIGGLFVAIFATLGFTTSRRAPDQAATPIRVLRLLAGTAFGEEALHRGFSLGLWCGAGAGPSTVVAANTVIFGLWHLASASRERFHVVEIVVPAIGALVFLWARLAFGSLLVPWLFHVATNIPLLALGRWERGPGK